MLRLLSLQGNSKPLKHVERKLTLPEKYLTLKNRVAV